MKGMTGVRRVALVAFLIAGAPFTSSRAQNIEALRAGVRRMVLDTASADSSGTGHDGAKAPGTEMPPVMTAPTGLRAHRPPKRFAALVSAIVPGGGQYMLGDNRFVAYAAVEFLTWLKFAKDIHEKTQEESSFRDIARRSARANFSSSPPDGNWTYYEAMRDFLQSGNYSLSDTKLVPENDPTTFNGYTWQVAVNTTPDADAALAQYIARAAHPDFLWSWQNAQLQYDRFVRTTENRNDAARAMTRDLTVIGLNHVLSLVDAFATFRLEVRPQVDGRMVIGASVPW
jgi:hypothetical protein